MYGICGSVKPVIVARMKTVAGHSWWRKIHRNYKVRRNRPKMWLVPEADTGYIKVTKVASTSIELALTTHLHCQIGGHPESEISRKTIREYSNRYSIHFSPSALRKNKPGFLFAFVRNPLDRLHSSYMNKVVDVRAKGEEHNIFWNHDITLDMSFPDFVRRVADIPDHAIDRHLRSQHTCIADEKGLVTDYIGKFEQLSNDWVSIADRLGLPRIPHQNPSSRDTKKPWDLETARIAASRYARDIELLGYQEEVDKLLASLAP